MRKKIVALAFAAILIVCNTMQGYAANNAVEAVKNSIVRVIAFGNFYTYTGSAFYLGRDDKYEYYVTNDHVISEDDDVIEAFGIILTDTFSLDGIIQASASYQTNGRGKDIAVIKVERERDAEGKVADKPAHREPVTLGSTVNLKVTDEVFALGFPGSVDEFTDDSAVNLPSEPRHVNITSGKITNLEREMSGAEVLLIDTEIGHGNSGGPLVDENGYVVGINTFGLEEGLNAAIKIDELIEILDANGIPYNNKGEKNAAKSSDNNGESDIPLNSGIIVTGVVILVVAIIIIFIIVKLLGRKPKSKNRRVNSADNDYGNDEW